MNEGHNEMLQIAFDCVLPFGSLAAVPHDTASQESTRTETAGIPLKHILGLICAAWKEPGAKSLQFWWLTPGSFFCSSRDSK